MRKARKVLKSGKLRQTKKVEQGFDYYLVFDVEATCVHDRSFDYPNEIIEFPVVMLNAQTLEIVSHALTYFHF